MCESQSLKRKRGKNFNENEKSSLLDIVAAYKNVIECVRTDVKSVKEKNKVWESIQNEYNSIQSSGYRNIDQLKALYDILKRNAKKEKSNDKVELYKTGGGRKNSTVSALSEKVIGILGDQIEPLNNEFDSDADFVNNFQCEEIPISSESYSIIEVSAENDFDSTIDVSQNQGQVNNTENAYIADCEINSRPNKECSANIKYKTDHKKIDLREDSPYTGKGVYKSLLEVSNKRLKRTDLLTKYEEDILQAKLESALIHKETATVELNIAKQKLVTEQYIYESLKQNADKS